MSEANARPRLDADSFVSVFRGNADPSDAYDKIFGPEEIVWFKGQTGIQDDAELKKHVLTVQEEAVKIFPYGCIRGLTYAKTFIRGIPAYKSALKVVKERKGALFLDFACCFGNDLRNAVADGVPAEQALAADLHPEFWALGHKLFRSTPETFPVHFIPCDVFNPEHIAPADPVYDAPKKPLPDPLSKATTLTEFQGHIAVIHSSAFFHLFTEEQQTAAAHALASLLSPIPGSMIFGTHLGAKEPYTRQNDRGETIFSHSPESWTKLWDGEVFKKGSVKVEATLVDFIRIMVKGEIDEANLPQGLKDRRYFLSWSVTRL